MPNLTNRLGAYLKAAHPLLATRQTPAPIIDIVRARHFLEKATDLLRQLRLSGAFIDLWAVAGLGRNEVRNATVLAWLLDPQGSHGFGASMIEQLIEFIARQANFTISKGGLCAASVATEECPLGNDRDRVDISITGLDFVIFIEVKIDAREGDRQLERYVETLNAKRGSYGKEHGVVVYLSPRALGKTPAGVIEMTWRDMRRILVDVARRETGLGQTMAIMFARHVQTF